MRGLNNDKIQRANRSLILQIIIEHKIVSRIELAKMTGLKKPTITNIINEFLAMGIIMECEMPKKAGMRKTEGLTLKAEKVKVLSARWIRSFFAVDLYTFSGELVDKARCPISTEDEVLDSVSKIFDTVDRLIEQHDSREILGISVGIPGPYIRGQKNVAIVAGYDKLKAIDIQQLFEAHFSFPVFTEHDAKLSALAEWKNMEHQDRSTCKCLLALQSLGIGIGAGIVLNGKILHGAFGIAGEIGQIGIHFNGPKNFCGENGTLETYASSESVKKYVAERMFEFPESPLTENSTYEEILEAYYANDSLAVWAFDAMAWKLSYGLVSALFVISPDKIIIGPDYPNTDRFIQKIMESIRQMVDSNIYEQISISYSTLKDDPTLLGGYHHVLESFVRDDSIFERLKALLDKSDLAV